MDFLPAWFNPGPETPKREETSLSPAAEPSRTKPQVLFHTESKRKTGDVFSESSALPALENAQGF